MTTTSIYKMWLGMCVIMLSFVLLTACGDNGEDVSHNDHNGTKSNVAIGEEFVKTSCITCHGRDLKGNIGPSLVDTSLSKDEIIEVLKNGRGSMPKNLAKGKEEAVAEYILSLK